MFSAANKSFASMKATYIHCCRHRCTSAANLHFNELPLLGACDASARPRLGLVSRQGLTCFLLWVSMCLIHSYIPIKNDLRVSLKRCDRSSNALRWRSHWPHSRGSFVSSDVICVHLSVSFLSLWAAIKGTFAHLICTNEAIYHVLSR